MLPFFVPVCFECRVTVFKCRVNVWLYGIEFMCGCRGFIAQRELCILYNNSGVFWTTKC